MKSLFNVVAYNSTELSKPVVLTGVAANRVKRIVKELRGLGYTNLAVNQIDDSVKQLSSNPVRAFRV